MVRNEADIIGLTVLHHLSLGLDRILVLDNGSTDGTDKILRLLGKGDERVAWTRDDSPFDQQTITTELAREAYRQGADWVVPFDADEFWLGDAGNFRNILSHSEAGALWAQTINFVQARSQLEPAPDSLLTMTRRAVETVPASNLARRMLESHQIGLVQITAARNYVSRPTDEVKIWRGNHVVSGVRGEHAKGDGISCFHAPLRSRALLASKMERSQRLREAGVFGGVWHWARMIEQGNLDQEWAANSYDEDRLDVYGKRYPVLFDPRLRDVVAPLIPRLARITQNSPSG